MVDRHAELALLQEALERGRSGSATVIMLEGELGSGRTSLLDRIAADAEGSRVIRLRGTGAERPYADLDALLAQLPGRGRERTDDDHELVAAGLVRSLVAASAQKPLLVLLDDADRLDRGTLRALRAGAPRLRNGRVVVIAATRWLTVGTAPADGVRTVRLRGLDVATTIALAAEHGIPELRPALAHRLVELTGGNPLHLAAAFDELGASLLAGIPAQLPVPRASAAELAGRLAALPEEARTLIDVVALADDPLQLPVVAAVAAELGGSASLDDALPTGLLSVETSVGQRQVSITSARDRQTLAAAVPAARRRRIHAALAGHRSGSQRLRHRLAAVEFADDGLAVELREAAVSAVQRGDYAAAARRLAESSGVSTRRDDRERGLLEAAELAVLADAESGAVAFAGALDLLPPSSRRDLALSGLSQIVGSFDDAQRRLAAADRDPAGIDPRMRAVVAGGIAWALGDPVAVLEAVETAPPADDDTAAPVADPLGRALAGAVDARRRMLAAGARWLGGVQPPLEALRPMLHPGDGSPVRQGHAEARIMLGQAALYGGRHRDSRAVLELAVTESRASGSVPTLQLALAVLGLSLYITGDWAAADPVVDEVLTLSLETGNGTSDAIAHAVIAMMSAQRHDRSTATRAIVAARGLERRRPVPQTTAIVMMAAALVERGRHDPEAVLAALSVFEDSAAGYAVDGTGALGWRVLRAEALVELGRRREAESLLAAIPPQTTPLFGHPDWVRGRAAELRGDPSRAAELYRAAADGTDQAESPWSRAVALSALGRMLAELGETTESARVLRLARAARIRLGIEDDASREAADPTAPEPDGGWESLSAREREIAELAAGGRINREIAEELHISVKTVEYHLSRAMAKLGVTSRRHLRR